MNKANNSPKIQPNSNFRADNSRLLAIVFTLAMVGLNDNLWAFLSIFIENIGIYSPFSQIFKAAILAAGLILFVARWESSIKIVSSVWIFVVPATDGILFGRLVNKSA